MSIRWSELSSATHAAIGAELEAARIIDEVISNWEDRLETERPVNLHDLYKVVRNPSSQITSRIAAALLSDQSLRKDYDLILASGALAYAPVAAAAASTDLNERDHREFKLRFVPSETAPGQSNVYLTLKMEFERMPSSLFITPPNGVPVKVALPIDIDGLYHLIFADDDPVLAALQDTKTEIVIR